MALPIPKQKLFTLVGTHVRFAGCAWVQTKAPVFSMCEFENNLVTGHADGYINFWSLHFDLCTLDQSKKINAIAEYSIKACLQAVQCMAVWSTCSLNDFKPLLLTCGDQSIKIWKADRTLFHEIKCAVSVVSVALVNNYIVTGSYDGMLDVWKLHLGDLDVKEEPSPRRERRYTISGLLGMSQKDVPMSPSKSRKFSFFSKKKEPTTPLPVRANTEPPSFPLSNNDNNVLVIDTAIRSTKLCCLVDRSWVTTYDLFAFKGTFEESLLCSSIRHQASIWTPTSTLKPTFVLKSGIDGHKSSVRCFAEWNQHLVTGSVDQTIKVWIVASDNSQLSLKCKMTLQGHKSYVSTLCVWGNHLCSGSKDKSIRMWNWKGECVSTFLCHKDDVTCLTVWNNLLFAGSYDKSLSVWQGKDVEVCTYVE